TKHRLSLTPRGAVRTRRFGIASPRSSAVPRPGPTAPSSKPSADADAAQNPRAPWVRWCARSYSTEGEQTMKNTPAMIRYTLPTDAEILAARDAQLVRVIITRRYQYQDARA